MVWLKEKLQDLLWYIKQPYVNWRNERRARKIIKEMQDKDPFIYK